MKKLTAKSSGSKGGKYKIMTKYGYCRISTKTQMVDGTYKAQMAQLENEGVTAENIYFDNLSGKNLADRLELHKLLERANSGDIIVITKLDRLARNVKDALNIIEELNQKGVTLDIKNMGRFDDTPSGRLTFTIFSAFAEYERDLILERMQSGKEYAREHNPEFKEGRPKKMRKSQIEMAYKRLKTETYKDVADSFNISERTLYNYIRAYKDSLTEGGR